MSLTPAHSLRNNQARRSPGLDAKFSDEAVEPVVVKNLESVHGDERDVIFLSTTYGRDDRGELSMNFGPLNKSGGERRLTVAVARARAELVVFSSITAADIDLNRTAAQGVHDLRRFLDYADRGAEALPSAGRMAAGGPDAFTETVAAALRARGWSVDTDIGLSSARVDVAVRDPRDPNRYLEAIQCDGPNWAQGATALDRERTLGAVMTSLGWSMRRERLLEWWRDPEGAAERLDAALRSYPGARVEERQLQTEPEMNQLRMVCNAA